MLKTCVGTNRYDISKCYCEKTLFFLTFKDLRENVRRKCGFKGLIKDQYLPHQSNPLMYSLCSLLYLIISLCPFLIMVHMADIVSEHALEAVSLITTLNPTSPQLLLQKHKQTHTHTPAPPTVAPPSTGRLSANTATCKQLSANSPHAALQNLLWKITNHALSQTSY